MSNQIMAEQLRAQTALLNALIDSRKEITRLINEALAELERDEK